MLHQDLITEILLRLPVKSLLRFKCVSKQWLSLISDPHFRHNRRSLSSSGIILCRTTDLIHHTILPNDGSGSTTISGVYLVFDPTKSPHYHVFRIRICSSASHSYQIETYSSETRNWRLSGSPLVVPFDMVFDNGVLWNGAIHWISPSGASVCFDIGEERLGSMPSPPSNEKWSRRRFRYFGESGGHLHLIEIYGSGTTQFQVFEMEKDYSSWLPKYNVDLAQVVDAFPNMVRNYLDPSESPFYAFSLLFVQEDEEDSFLLLHIPGKFVSYNLRNRTFKELGSISTETSPALQIGCLHAYQFSETLAGV